MTHDELAPFLDKYVAVSLKSGDAFEGFLRERMGALEVDAGSSQTSIDAPEAIERVELLKT